MRKRKALPPPRPRTRKRLNCTRLVNAGVYYWVNNGVQGTVTNVPAAVTLCEHQTDDIVTPGYKQLVAAGQLINNRYTSVKRSLTGGDNGDIQVEWKSGSLQANLFVTGFAFRDGCGILSGGATPPLPNRSNITGYVQTKALSGVEAASLQTGVAIGEFRKTMQTLVSPLRSLLRWHEKASKEYARDLKNYGRKALETKSRIRTDRYRMKVLRANAKGLDKKTKSLLERYISKGGDAADLVLSYNLGWKPILMDIDALLNKIPSLEVTERRWSRATREQETTQVDYSTKATAYGTNRIKSETKIKVKVRAGVLYQDKFEASHHFGTRLSDIPETVWELIPGSFLVDYVVNVGDYLGALRAQAYSQNVLFYTAEEIVSEQTRTWESVQSIIAHPGVNNVVGSVKTWMPGNPEVLTYEAKSRWPDSFGPTISRVQYSHERPAAQLQNVMSLLTKSLMKIR